MPLGWRRNSNWQEEKLERTARICAGEQQFALARMGEEVFSPGPTIKWGWRLEAGAMHGAQPPMWMVCGDLNTPVDLS